MLESTSIERVGAKLNFKHGKIEMAHGVGGRAMHQLIEQLFLPAFSNQWLQQRNDQACFQVDSGRMVMTTDSHVISPIFFPGGDIGKLAVNGTLNDIAMAGAIPLYLTVGFILEEGLPLADLQQIVFSMAAAARQAGVAIIAGDTKVVERGKGDGIFITTTGIGTVPTHIEVNMHRPQPGDKIILSGDIGDHGIAIMSTRANLTFGTQIMSDTAPLHDLVAMMVEVDPTIRCMRDPTRGGLATTLNEWVNQYDISIDIDEKTISIKEPVKAACELFGLDPLYIANEGKLVAICHPDKAYAVLTAMRSHELGKTAAIIGEVSHNQHGFVQMQTLFGGKRIVDWLVGDQLPRIC
ncbi:MAG: hydrogenase expression/formation protein HypE [Gammaproteobacteria bacterium]